MPTTKEFSRKTLKFSPDEVEAVMRKHAAALGYCEFANKGKVTANYRHGIVSAPEFDGYSFALGDESRWPT